MRRKHEPIKMGIGVGIGPHLKQTESPKRLPQRAVQRYKRVVVGRRCVALVAC